MNGTLAELKKLCEPVAEWLIENTDMMCEVVVTSDTVEVKRIEAGMPFDEDLPY